MNYFLFMILDITIQSQVVQIFIDDCYLSSMMLNAKVIRSASHLKGLT
jgi:hypothetical protein